VRDASWPLDGLEHVETEDEAARDTRLAGLVENHFDFVWRVLRRLGAEPADADDAVQEVFMIATRRLDDIAPGAERTFLYGTARRVASNMRRTLRRRPEIHAELDEVETTDVGPDARAELSRAGELLRRLLEHLSPELRRVLVLAEIEQLEVAEIARLEQLKLGTAASRLRRARQAFQQALEEIAPENPFASEEP
jgi:RNA polymerase sigma-70 factor (ECF subfamily)